MGNFLCPPSPRTTGIRGSNYPQNQKVSLTNTHLQISNTRSLQPVKVFPIVCNDLQLGNAQVSQSVTTSKEIIQNTNYAPSIGLSSDEEVIAILAQIFAKYEIPMGLVSKVLGLRNFDVLEMIVDDSGSMSSMSDNSMTRWQEVYQRICKMFEIVAYVPINPCFIRFLNRNTVIEAKRNENERPEQYLQRLFTDLTNVWASPPSGGTPAYEKIKESLDRYPGKTTLRYFFGDGQPNRGAEDARNITFMLINRQNPEKNPFTFLSCTNDDAAVEWMKECEEAAPFCAELDDFVTETNEVLLDQGRAFPYSYGVYLISELVAAFNPDDLDAMDESVPLTKQTMDNLLGYVSSDQQYNTYFGCFLEAQNAKPVRTVLDKLKKDHVTIWHQNIEGFRQAPLAQQIPFVFEYKRLVADLKKRGH